MHLRDLFPVLLILACTPKPADTDGESGPSGSSGAGTEGAEVTSVTEADSSSPPNPSVASNVSEPTTDLSTEPPPQTASSTPGTDTIPNGTATEDTATDTSETEGGDACLDVCTLWDMCEPGIAGPLEECVAECRDVEGAEPACVTSLNAMWECVAGLSCEEALKFLTSDPTSCLAEAQTVDEACAGEECNGEIGGDMVMCELERECGMGKQHIACDGEKCVCSQDDVVVKECADEELCSLGFEEQRAAITACCGWDWTL